MSDTTKIEWCDHSWSPWEGCTKVSPGCLNCYAEARDKRHLFGPESHWGKGAQRRLTKDWKKPVKWNREASAAAPYGLVGYGSHRPKVFPSVCDWLDDEVPIEWLSRFLQLIHDTPHLDWLLLTKRPENFGERILRALAHVEGIDYESADAWEGDANTECGQWLNDWSSDDATPPHNVWVGTSVEDQTRANQRVPALLKLPARVRFLSVEPLLGPVRLEHIDAEGSGSAEWCQIDALTGRHTDMGRPCQDVPKLDWVIVGGESGRHARPCNVEWVRSIVTQCADAGVPCFVKQLGARVIDRNDRGFEGDSGPSGWPMDTDIGDTVEPGIYQGKPIIVRLRHPKGGDPSEWPENLRVRQFPEVKS